MKTYLFDTFNRYKRFSDKLDAKTILCNRSWWVFNDNGDKEVYIFQKDGTLIISIRGRVSYSTWKYITANQSIIITSGEQSYMVIPAFVDSNILALQVDGTDEYAFLIDEDSLKRLVFKTYNDVLDYFEQREKDSEQEVPKIEVRTIEPQSLSNTDIIVIIVVVVFISVPLIIWLIDSM